MNPMSRCTLTALAAIFLTSLAPGLCAQEKARLAARVAPTQTVAFDIYLPLQHRDALQQLLSDQQNPDSPLYRQWLKPAQFNAQFGPDPAQVSAVQAQLTSFGLKSRLVSARHLKVTGSGAAIEQAFNTVLKNGSYSNGSSTVVAVAPITPSGAMLKAGALVGGLNGVVYMRSHAHSAARPQNRYSTAGPYWFDDLKQAYKFPSYLAYNGTGTHIGILMSGDFNPPDMDIYFGSENLATPSFSTVQVDGGAPYDPNNSLETHLDLQQSGGMAPRAKITLYNIPDLSDDSILDGLDAILTDNLSDVVNMSFGGAELFYTAAFNGGTDYTYLLQLENDFFAQGNAQGISFVASSGDAGALAAFPVECFNYGPNCGAALLSAEFPASSPHVTGVGGTNLATVNADNSLNSTYVSEQAFADPLEYDIFYGTSATGQYWGSGGGVSIIFPKPNYQNLVGAEGSFRNVPDVALHMGGCPSGATQPCNPQDSSDLVAIDTNLYEVVGTSASSPDFAGLLALGIERFGTRIGNANFYFYGVAYLQQIGQFSGIFNNNIPGFNGFYSTKKGYNRVLGNGTVNGAGFIFAPKAVAGTPQTPSNP
jgi:subtilase family serine protease